MDLLTLILFVLGLVVLVLGAELLVRGASSLASAVGVSQLVIGLTIVAYGTSAPELAVSVNAALAGEPDIAIGNIVGSNICNVLLILGLSAVITPLVVDAQLVRIDVPLMIAASVAMWLMAADGTVTRGEGVLLLAAAVGYSGLALWLGKRASGEAVAVAATRSDEHPAAAPPPRGALGIALNVLLIAFGLGMLVLGARWLVAGAVAIAQFMGVSELVIGLTVIAVGTSLPEVATSVVAAIRGQRDIAVGNVVGSNIFNIVLILGSASVVTPVPVAPAVLGFDLPVMTAVAFACLPIFFTGHLIARWEGGVFLAYYAIYTVYLVLHAAKHQALYGFSVAVLYFVVPITVLTILVTAYRAVRAKLAPTPV